ncbi:MAG: helix-turn-helix domain-containing protein [Archangiaceae bacterium]|nr:helix-turn-helix domain-containing protein [Archangiaceae bacterium]
MGSARASASKRFGLRLRALRLERELSQEQLAEAAGMSRDAVARLELGGRWPRLDTALRLAEALMVSLAELTVGAGPEPVQHERLTRALVGLNESDLELLVGVAALLRRRR